MTESRLKCKLLSKKFIRVKPHFMNTASFGSVEFSAAFSLTLRFGAEYENETEFLLDL